MKRWLLLLCCALLLSACVGVPVVERSIGETQRELNSQQLQALDKWRMSGRVAYSQNRQSWQSTINWHHAKSVDKWRISSLLIGTLAELEYEAGKLFMINDKGGRELKSNSELIDKLGFAPPFDYLQYWLRGLVSPFSQSTYHLDDNGFIASIDQQGWVVTLSRYEYTDQLWLPSKVSLQKGTLKIKVIVDEWS